LAECPNGWPNGWIVEEGIGEHRALLIHEGNAIAAKVDWPGGAEPGLVADAILISRAAGSPRGTVRMPGGEEALIDGLPRDASEGAAVRVRIVRAAIAEKGRLKRAQARVTEEALRPAPSLAGRLKGRVVRAFLSGLWEDIAAEAFSGEIAFPGGSIIVSPTPAMTVIDIDGIMPPRVLALAAIPAIAAAIRRFDLGGSIAIDFPALAGRAERREVDEALACCLEDWPHERTAMNGFGMVQLVARLEGPSLLQRYAADVPAAAARQLLRRAQRVEQPGALLLTAGGAVRSAMQPAWEAELARRTGRRIIWKIDDALAPEGAFAQAIAS